MANIVYAYSLVDPATNERVKWGYVGKTTQVLDIRHRQHMRQQPWSDLHPEIRIIKEFKHEWAMNLAEFWIIKLCRPIYNHDHNLNNSRRIPRYIAKRERAKRDLLRGDKK